MWPVLVLVGGTCFAGPARIESPVVNPPPSLPAQAIPLSPFPGDVSHVRAQRAQRGDASGRRSDVAEDGEAREDGDHEAPAFRQMIPPRSVDAAPPDRAAGYAVTPRRRNGWRWIPRIAFYLPRRAVELVTTPFEYALVVYQKYRLKYRVLDIFFDERRTFGIIPTAFVETGLGFNGGVRVFHHDLFGHGESLYLRLGWGGLYRHIYAARLGLGDLLGPNLDLSFDVRHAVRPRMPFFGIGNDDEIDDDTPLSLPLDPVATDFAVDTRYRIDEVRWGLQLGIRLTDHLQAVVEHRWTWAEFGHARGLSGSEQIAKVYDEEKLVGWGEGLFHHYTELALDFSWLRVRYPWISAVTPSSGWTARAYAGVADGIRGDPTELIATGGALARYFDLYGGDRVLLIRVAADAVHGRRDRIPFTSYPTLGGPKRLRGYRRDRFRDRFSTLLALEYRFPVNRRTSGFVFSEVGRVWPRAWIVDVRGLDRMRATFGGGGIFYVGDSLVTRIQVAGSVDGTFTFFFGL